MKEPRILNRAMLLWLITVSYVTYTGVFNGAIQLVLEQKGYGTFLFAVAIALYIGFIAGSTLENILERYLQPTTISTVAAWVLFTCMCGYLLLFKVGGDNLPVLMALRFIEGLAATSVYDAAFYLFKKNYEEEINKALSLRGIVATWTTIAAASVSYALMTQLSVEGWLMVNGCIVTLILALLATTLEWSERNEEVAKTDNENNPEKVISRKTIFLYMLGVLAPTLSVNTVTLVYFPGYVEEHAPHQVSAIMTATLLGETIGRTLGSFPTKSIPVELRWAYLILSGYTPITGGLILLSQSSSPLIMILSLSMIGWGNVVVINIVEASLQRLKQSLGRQEGMKSLATDSMRFGAMLLFGGLVVNTLGRQTMWLMLAVLPIVSIAVLPKWVAFVHVYSGKEEESHVPQLKVAIANTLAGVSFWNDLLRRG